MNNLVQDTILCTYLFGRIKKQYFSNTTNSTNIVNQHISLSELVEFRVIVFLVIVTLILNLILKLYNSIMSPYLYKLNMTTKEYCKQLAEIDNDLLLFKADQSIYNNKLNHQFEKNNNCTTNCDDDLLDLDYFPNIANNTLNSATKSVDNNKLAYPNGWLPIIESSKVLPDKIKKVIFLGRDLIITRSSINNSVSVLSAYCPHMGVHIGVGGRVVNIAGSSCVECPFHGWTFSATDGNCVLIPYQKSDTNIPKQAKLAIWPCIEVENFVYVWHHATNKEPTWYPKPELNEYELQTWRLAGHSSHTTNFDIRDMLENGADMNHFEAIHNDLFVLGSNILELLPLKSLQKFFKHCWNPSWSPIIDEVTGQMTHVAIMRLQSWITFFGLRVFDITVNAKQEGPARVNLRWNSRWYGTGLLTMNAIPLGGRRMKYIQNVYTKPTLFNFFMAKMVSFGEIKMLERDFMIWNHKKSLQNPTFSSEDKTLKQFRRWYRQFYSTKSIVIKSS